MTSRRIALWASIAAATFWTAKSIAIGLAGGLDKSPLEAPLFFLGLISFVVAVVALGVALTAGPTRVGPGRRRCRRVRRRLRVDAPRRRGRRLVRGRRRRTALGLDRVQPVGRRPRRTDARGRRRPASRGVSGRGAGAPRLGGPRGRGAAVGGAAAVGASGGLESPVDAGPSGLRASAEESLWPLVEGAVRFTRGWPAGRCRRARG